MANYLDPYAVNSNTGQHGSLADDIEAAAQRRRMGLPAYPAPGQTPLAPTQSKRTLADAIDLSKPYQEVPIPKLSSAPSFVTPDIESANRRRAMGLPPIESLNPDEVERQLNAAPPPAPKKRTVQELRRAHSKLSKDENKVAKDEAVVAKLDEKGEPIPTFTNAGAEPGAPEPTFEAPPGPAAPLASANAEGMLATAPTPKPTEPSKPSDGLTPVEGKTTTVHTVPNADYAAAAAKEPELTERQKGIEARATEVNRGNAQANVDMYSVLATEKARLDEENKKVDAQATKTVLEREKQKDTLVAQLSKEKTYKGLVGEMGGGSKILLAIGLALGGVGAGLAGGRNQAYDALMNRIDQDFQLQRAKIADLKDEVAISMTGINDAKDAKQKLTEDHVIKEQALLTKLKLGLEAKMAQSGLDKVAIDNDQKTLDLDARLNASQKADALQFSDKVQEETQRKKLVLKGAAKQNLTGMLQHLATPVREDAQYKDLAAVNKEATSYSEAQRVLADGVRAGNPKALQASMTEAMRIVNGGVLSDNERQQLVNNSGGFIQRLKDGSLMFAEGMVSPQTVRNFAGLISDRRREKGVTATNLHAALMDRWGKPTDPNTGRPIYPPELLQMVVPKPYSEGGPAAAPQSQIVNVTLKDGTKVRARKNADGTLDTLEGG